MRSRIRKNLLALAPFLHHLAAQDCFFPDGAVAPDASSCSSSPNGQCCPLNWQCLSNGLCWLEAEDLLGRYSCTDQTWQSATCPQICTHNHSAGGNEAIRQCPDGRYCCDGDRSFDCCATTNADYFDLPLGTAYASVTEAPSPTSASALVGSSTITSILSSPSSSRLSTTPGPLSSSTTLSITSTNAAGHTVTIVSVATAQPSPTIPTTNHAKPSNSRSLTIGLAVGIPLAGVLAATAIFLWYRHLHRTTARHKPDPNLLDPNNPDMRHSYGHFPPDGHAPELDSHPIAVGTNASTTELDGSPIPNSSHEPSLSPNKTRNSPAVSALSSPRSRPSPLVAAHSPPVPTQHMRNVNEHPAELWGGSAPARVPDVVMSERKDGKVERKAGGGAMVERSVEEGEAVESRLTHSLGTPVAGERKEGLGLELPPSLRIGKS